MRAKPNKNDIESSTKIIRHSDNQAELTPGIYDARLAQILLDEYVKPVHSNFSIWLYAPL